MEKTIVIIDGNSLINRAYYAMQRPMITKDGIYTQGVYGFLNMFEKIKRDYEPGYIVVTFDKKAPTFRHLEYKEYKAGRKKMPPELAMQMPLIKEVLDAMNVKRVEMEGFEADDLIGTIARAGEEAGFEPLIITGDKDELQLATKITKVLITKKGISSFDLYDEDAMIEKYGFTPTQFIDYKGLMGDQSDNIPGIPGVGEKTAMQLMLEYGSVENLIANVDKISKVKLKEKIEEHAQLALMSKRLATINTHVPFDIDFDEYKSEEANFDQLIDVYTKLEFNSFLRKLDKGDAPVSAQVKEMDVDFDQVEKQIIGNVDQLKSMELPDEVVIKVLGDNNHVNKPAIDGICIMSTKVFYYISCEEEGMLKQIVAILNEKAPKLIGHQLKEDLYMLMMSGLEKINIGFDIAIGQYVLESNRSNYDLKTLAFEYFHKEIPSEKEFLSANSQMDLFGNSSESYSEYGKQVCVVIANLKNALEKKIIEEDLEQIMYQVELPLIEVMASMEVIGVAVDKNELENQGKDLTSQIDILTQKIHELAGEEFNINSPKQLGPILFEKLGLTPGKKTKTGYSTSAATLEKIQDENMIVPLILEYRTLTKLNGTYIEGMIPLINDDNRIHAHFNQTVTTTGRISCTEPNLQNIPIRQEFGRKVRKAFATRDQGSILIGADYSQIELRVLAHMADDQLLIDAFNRGEDIHKLTASNVLSIPEDEITIEQRSRAKAVNFGVIYGMSAFGLATELHIGRKEADDYIKAYFAKHVAVKQFMDHQVALCKAKGYVTTIMGRKRYISEINASGFMVRQMGERLAMNTPIQGSAADIIKIAMVKVYNQLKRDNLESRLILQVHDELIIETVKGEEAAVEKLLIDNMENAVELKAQLIADLNSGTTWYGLK
ncbi:MAG: DNA polymerase I [Anaerovoracaceae bacterium]